MTDQTFSDFALYGSARWCAATLGQSLPWFTKNRPVLEREGFPPVDTLIGLTCKQDVEAWVARRRRLPDAQVVVPIEGHHDDMQPRIDINAL